MLWNLPSYERLVGTWALSEVDATAAVTWLLDKVVAMVAADVPPLPVA